MRRVDDLIDPDAVRAFMAKHGLALDLAQVPEVLKRKRIRLMVEELAETVEAIDQDDRLKIADGLGDLIYVVIGTALVYGLPIGRIFNEIHRSNMSKRPMTAEQKGGKGAGYQPPRIADLLRKDAA